MKQKVMGNALWLMAGRGMQMVLSLLVGLLSARYLGPEGYGLLQYAAGYTGFFSALAALGLDTILIPELTAQPEQENRILGTAMALQGAAGMLSSLAILCLLVLTREEPLTAAAAVLSSISLGLRCGNVLQAKFQADLQSRTIAVTLLVAHILGAVYRGLLLILGKGVLWFAAAAAVEQFCAGSLLLWQYGWKRKLVFSREMAGNLLKKGAPFILPGLMVAVYGQTDRIMLGRLLGTQEAGYYGAAVSICGSWCFVLNALIDAMYPQIARAYGNRERFLRLNKQLYAWVFYGAAAVSLGICLLAEPLMGLLYGRDFLPAVPALRVLSWYTAFSYLGVARNAWVVCKRRQGVLIWVYLAAAAGNVGLNALLIPRWGSMGAAWASLAAQMLSAVIVPLWLPALRENGRMMLEAIALRGVLGKEADSERQSGMDGSGPAAKNLGAGSGSHPGSGRDSAGDLAAGDSPV